MMIIERSTLTPTWMKQLVAIMERLLPTGVILDGQKCQGMNPERASIMGCGA